MAATAITRSVRSLDEVCGLMLEHGGPKSARLFRVGHTGHTPQTMPASLNWLVTNLKNA